MGIRMGCGGEDMTPTRGVVWVRGVLASVISVIVFGFIWVAVQPTRTLMLTEHSVAVLEEAAEKAPEAKGINERHMDRAAAIQKAEDLVAARDDEAAPIEMRAEAERQLQEHLAENFPIAAGDSRLQPTVAVPEPKNGDSHGAPTWGEILRNFVNGALPYLFVVAQGVIAWRTKKKLVKAKE